MAEELAADTSVSSAVCSSFHEAHAEQQPDGATCIAPFPLVWSGAPAQGSAFMEDGHRFSQFSWAHSAEAGAETSTIEVRLKPEWAAGSRQVIQFPGGERVRIVVPEHSRAGQVIRVRAPLQGGESRGNGVAFTSDAFWAKVGEGCKPRILAKVRCAFPQRVLKTSGTHARTARMRREGTWHV